MVNLYTCDGDITQARIGNIPQQQFAQDGLNPFTHAILFNRHNDLLLDNRIKKRGHTSAGKSA
jgi:hypothetical protein